MNTEHRIVESRDLDKIDAVAEDLMNQGWKVKIPIHVVYDHDQGRKILREVFYREVQ